MRAFFGAAATPVPHRVIRIIPVGIAKATDVEAGSNIAPGAPTTGKSMNDAFNVHTLMAGEWSYITGYRFASGLISRVKWYRFNGPRYTFNR